MRSFSRRILGALLTLTAMALPFAATAQDENPFIGIWDLDNADSNFGNSPVPKNMIRTYADAGDVEAGTEVGIGVASLFRDQANQSRWIATLTAPDIASFEAAGRSLARSDLWMALEGRAAVWSARGVTALDYAVVSPTLTERAREFALDHTRDAALLLFGAAFLLLLRGFFARRKTLSAQS